MAAPSAEESQQTFVWPPSQPPPPAPTHPPAVPTPRLRPSSASGIWSALRRMFHDAERVWLDVRCPVLRERLDALGWKPDAPHSYCALCGQSLEPRDPPGAGCRRCTRSRPGWSRLVRLGPYEPPLTRLVQEVKFTRWRRLGTDLGTLLGEAVAAQVEGARQRDPGFPTEIVVVPVPMSFRRRLARGIDHSHTLAASVARAVGGTLARPVWRKHRRSQLQVLPSERAGNMARAVYPRRRQAGRLRGRLVILVDDVTTTGATLRATARAVRAAARPVSGHGAQRPPVIWVAVLAVTELRRGKVAGSDEEGAKVRTESEVGA